jgi:uncharacterized membrane protein
VKTKPFPGIRRDTRGVAAPIVALLGAVLIGATGVALDAGLYFSQSSNLRSVTEAAALSAAAGADITKARANALTYLANNGYPASKLKSIVVTLGYYCPDGDASTKSFSTTSSACPGGTMGNTALKLETTAQSTSYLTSALGGGALIPQLASSATATRIDEAGLEMTTGVLALNPGLVNSLLSALAGRNIALTGAQLQVLLASNIDAGLMFDALAARVGQTGNYGTLVNSTVSLADLLSACATAAATDNAPASAALLALAAQVGGGIQVPLAGLFNLGVWKNTPIDAGGGGTSRKTGLRAGLNSYQLITYALQSGGRTANLVNLSIGVTGVAAVRLAGMVTSPFNGARFAFGPRGETTVGTAKLRLLLKVQILDPGALLGGLGLPVTSAPAVDLPLLLQLGEGTASVSGISCGSQAATDTRVTVAAQSGLLDVFLGNMPTDVLSPTRVPVTAADITPVDLLNVLGIVRVQLRTTAGQVTATSTTATFVQSGASGGNGIIGRPPYGGTAATLGNSVALANTLSTLQIQPTVCLNIILVYTCVTTGSLVNSVASLVAAPITALGVDPLVDSLLRGLGLQLGYANVWVTGARCGVPVLV